MSTNSELIDLQMRIAHLEHTVDSLNDVIIEQGRELEQMRKLSTQILQLGETLKPLLNKAQGEETPPPHY